jgi:hypothetical protein
MDSPYKNTVYCRKDFMMLIVDKFISKWCFHKLAITMFEQSLNWMFSNKLWSKSELVFLKKSYVTHSLKLAD